jgi:hypothetical protein
MNGNNIRQMACFHRRPFNFEFSNIILIFKGLKLKKLFLSGDIEDR